MFSNITELRPHAQPPNTLTIIHLQQKSRTFTYDRVNIIKLIYMQATTEGGQKVENKETILILDR